VDDASLRRINNQKSSRVEDAPSSLIVSEEGATGGLTFGRFFCGEFFGGAEGLIDFLHSFLLLDFVSLSRHRVSGS
jgi:hypothetical protein